MRQIVLDTETTGLDALLGDRIIEIGCVELDGREVSDRRFHCYINPERDSHPDALRVHQLSTEFLSDKPKFADVSAELIDFIQGAELLIHNASFDVTFLDAEFARVGAPKTAEICKISDTLVLARKLFPGQHASLDALCRRFEIDNSHRSAHGALLDAELLAAVYLAMTRGQNRLDFSGLEGDGQDFEDHSIVLCKRDVPRSFANGDELLAHAQRLQQLDKKSGGRCRWLELEPLS